MAITQERMIRIANAGRALIKQLAAMQGYMKSVREACAEGDMTGAINLLDTAILESQPHHTVVVPIELEAQHFERHGARNDKIAAKQATQRLRAGYGLTEPPLRRNGVPAHTEPPKGHAFYDLAPEPELFIPPPSVGRMATPQGADFARIAEPTQTRGISLADYLADPSLDPGPMPPRQPPTLSELGVRGKGDRADIITSVPDDVNATPELGADPFARGGADGAGD